MKKVIFLGCLLLAVSFSLLAQENITITTYYPAPFGVYNEMRSKRMAVGPAYYDQSQYLSFDNDGSLAANEIGRYADLIVQRYLGVGTHQPLGELHVKERPMANGSGNANRPTIYLEDINTLPATTDTYKFALRLKSPRSDNLHGLNLYFPMHATEPSQGMFMQVDENQNVRIAGDVSIKGSGARAENTGLEVEGGVKIGYATSCAGAGADNGLVRYDSANKAMEYCEDGVWKTMGSAKMHMAKMVRSSAQSIPEGGHRKINLNNEIFDYGNIARPGGGRFVIRQAGIYLVTASWRCGGFSRSHRQAGDSEMGAFIYVNGAALGQSDSFVKGPVNETGYAIVQDTYRLNAGDVVDVRVSHTAGGTRNTQTGVDGRPRMSVVQLR
jgi:hypothetical protein